MSALIVAPIILLVAVVKVLEAHEFPDGDIRNEPLFWIVLGVGALLLACGLVAGSIRELRKPGTGARF